MGADIRVFVVDDRSLPRVAARAILGDSPGLVHVGDASSGLDAIAAISQARPDVVLMDVEMVPLDGAETTRRLVALHPGLIIIAWTVSETSDDLLRMIEAGCAGYILKDVGPLELQHAIAAAIRHEAPLPRRMLPDVLRRAARGASTAPSTDIHLTERETQTLQLLARGTPTKQIAILMTIAQSSVDTHLRNIYRKLGVRNRGEAVSAALRFGLLSVSDLSG